MLNMTNFKTNFVCTILDLIDLQIVESNLKNAGKKTKYKIFGDYYNCNTELNNVLKRTSCAIDSAFTIGFMLGISIRIREIDDGFVIFFNTGNFRHNDNVVKLNDQIVNYLYDEFKKINPYVKRYKTLSKYLDFLDDNYNVTITSENLKQNLLEIKNK